MRRKSMTDRSPDLLKPTLIAGASFGALSALPVISLLNCACCALFIGCGIFASYLYSRECRASGSEFRPGGGALVGLVAVGFNAIVNALMGAIVQILIGDRIAQGILEWVQDMPNIPPETREMMARIMERSGSWSALAIVVGFLIALVLAAIFSTAGGLIGGALFRVARPEPEVRPPPVVPPDTFPPDFTP